MRDEIIDQLHKDGYVVLEGFLNEKEVSELRAEGERLADNAPEKSDRVTFCTKDKQISDDRYFLESGDKVRYFWEEGALANDGSLLVEKRLALNKVGHGLHVENPVFRRVTFDKRVKEVCWQLGLVSPVIPQSMYIYKNPGIGGEVSVHQDASYLYTEPQGLIGFWIALDDATLENGCLWMAPNSHRSGVHRRYIRNPDPNSPEILVYTAPNPFYQRSSFTAVPVSKGTCILIHGQTVHYSEPNRSEKSRNAYTFHIVEQKNVKYSEQNWLQPSEDKPFANVYNTKTI